jgi:hypothetical protein
LYFVHAALSAVGSAVTQRGEEIVSGRMMPTLAPLPSTAPPPPLDDDEALLAGAAGGVVVAVFFLLELHPVTTSAAAMPTIMMLIPGLRMGCHAFRVGVDLAGGALFDP